MDNKDLVWDLESFNKQQRAQNFVMGFENKLCVYSSNVEQLYTNYNIFFPKEENRKLVILPNPYAHYDTFQGINEEAVKATGLFIVPAEGDETKGSLQMVIPMKSENTKYRRVPLSVGLRLINQKRPPDRPFLPVLAKGDLRELDTNTPCLHLHMLQLSSLPKLSTMDVGDIQKVILKRLHELASR